MEFFCRDCECLFCFECKEKYMYDFKIIDYSIVLYFDKVIYWFNFFMLFLYMEICIKERLKYDKLINNIRCKVFINRFVLLIEYKNEIKVFYLEFLFY